MSYWKGHGGGYWGSSAHVNDMRRRNEEQQRAVTALPAEFWDRAAKRRASALKGVETRRRRAAERKAATPVTEAAE